MQNLEWRTEKRKVSDLVPYAKNPRQITETQFAQLKASLEKFNLVEIPAVDLDNQIIAGHQRLQIMRALGRGDDEIDVRVPNRKLTEDEFTEYNLRSNQNRGEWDMDVLSGLDLDLLKEIGFNMDELGVFDVNEIDSPDLQNGERATIRNITFTLHAEQIEVVEAALKKAKSDGGGISALNENSNGNAIAWICERFNRA